MTAKGKFKGSYMLVNQIGTQHLLFPKTGNHYTWTRVTTTINNMIMGNMWIDNFGETVIKNHKTGDQCHLLFHQYSSLSSSYNRRVTGIITHSDGVAMYILDGMWDDRMTSAKILSETMSKGKPVYKLADPMILWERRFPPKSLKDCYNFSELTVQMNEMEPDVAPTDSRHRPDQRLFEEGKLDEAEELKPLLEARQRENIAKKAFGGTQGEGYEPRWFQKQIDEDTGEETYRLTQDYKNCKKSGDWSRCPNIFVLTK